MSALDLYAYGFIALGIIAGIAELRGQTGRYAVVMIAAGVCALVSVATIQHRHQVELARKPIILGVAAETHRVPK